MCEISQNIGWILVFITIAFIVIAIVIEKLFFDSPKCGHDWEEHRGKGVIVYTCKNKNCTAVKIKRTRES